MSQKNILETVKGIISEKFENDNSIIESSEVEFVDEQEGLEDESGLLEEIEAILNEADDYEDEDSEDDDDEEVDESVQPVDMTGKGAKDLHGKGFEGTDKIVNTNKGKDKKNKKDIVPTSTNTDKSKSIPDVKKTKVKEELAALFGDHDLSEDFVKKATVIFEAAVQDRISEVEAELQEDYDNLLEEEVASIQEHLEETVTKFMNYVAEEWKEDNRLALENGVKNQIAENFILGLKDLFENNYIDVPDEKYDAMGELSNRIDELEMKLSEETDRSIELAQELSESHREIIFNRVSSGLVDTDVEKLRSLAEGLDFDSTDDYEDKLNTLREGYFNTESSSSTSLTEDVDDSNISANMQETPKGVMGIYAQSLGRHYKSY